MTKKIEIQGEYHYTTTTHRLRHRHTWETMEDETTLWFWSFVHGQLLMQERCHQAILRSAGEAGTPETFPVRNREIPKGNHLGSIDFQG